MGRYLSIRNIRLAACVWAAFALLPVGCTPDEYAQQADRDAYRMLSEGRDAALGEAAEFTVTYDPFCQPTEQREGLISIGEKSIPVGGGDPVALTLDECLHIAFRNSRAFQDRKEQLYTSALALANSRRGWWPPLFGGSVTAGAEHSRLGNDPSSQVDSGSADVGPTLTQKLVGGGALTLGVALSMATEFAGINDTTIGSLLEANFTQPLLRGAWRGLAYEDQYRSERNFLFSVFEYERFTQTFAVGIVEDYYDVLQRRDELENERSGIDRLIQTVALTQVQVEGGQVSRIQLDQAEQDLLNAQVRLESNEQGYRDSLDRFKLTLGLPVEASIELDYPSALKHLNELGPKPIPFNEAEAIEVALSTRPDVLRQRAALRDSWRDVEIAGDQFLPQLDVTFGVSAVGTEPRRAQRIRFGKAERFARIQFDYELDQTDNRDDYRRALIDLEKAERDYARFVDNVLLDVRRSYRTLLRSNKSFELQLRSVQIARRRSKLASLQQREGQASARDVLEAEEALRSAQNGVTSQLVDYTTTRLDFLASLGMLYVDEKGKLHERSEPLRFERIGRRYPHVVAP